jgi:hypothetical protein
LIHAGTTYKLVKRGDCQVPSATLIHDVPRSRVALKTLASTKFFIETNAIELSALSIIRYKEVKTSINTI